MEDRRVETPKAPAAQTTASSVKETVESILVAFILAFIFRAFVVEAFVIPTGSMAPTLLGAHLRMRCPDCGYEYTVNYMTRGEGEDVAIPRFSGPVAVQREKRDRDGNKFTYFDTVDRIYSIHCPNCGYKIPREQATNLPVHYGDRILVLKYLYLFQKPQRWDVVVFKSPTDPGRFDYGQNYIKRLVGQPGESVLLLDGDVYINETSSRGDLQQYRIQTKPYHVQKDLWRIVYDNDFYPQGVRRMIQQPWEQPWTPRDGTGWDVGGAQPGKRTFRFDNLSGSSTLVFDPNANPDKHAFTDWLAYDVTMNQGLPDSFTASNDHGKNTVADLKLELFYQRVSGPGPLRLRLTKLDDAFTAVIEPGKVSLLHRSAKGHQRLLAEATLDDPPPLHIEFTNVDYQVTLRINGRPVLQTTSEQYHPDMNRLMQAFEQHQRFPAPSVEIEAERQTCTVAHLSLWRDIYYTNRAILGEPLHWASPDDFPEHVIHLKHDEYFVLGDNSLISGDSRYWRDPIHLPHEDLLVESGRVPDRFLLGKAFFVYWPAGYRPIGQSPALIPNFGEMRFIH